ncbi:MAG: OsmC family protein [Anaerolineales bacterium]|nr:OsmC family protein [Anaerolineales bacterium]
MSAQTHIRDCLQGVMAYYTQNPDKALSSDKEAVAVIEDGLRVRAMGPDGQVLVCDMPKGLGGGATAPTPGWTMRAALANCEAVMIALRAAQLGIELARLEVRVASVSDDRGLLGMDDSKPAGPLNMTISVRIGAQGVPAETLQEIVAWAAKHSPVGEPLTRRIPTEHAVEIVTL